MKGLQSLIRLHKWQLEEERKKLARLLGARADLEAQCRRIREDLAAERKKAGQVDWLFAYPPYAAAAQKRLDSLAESIAELDGHIAEAEEHVSEAFAELKKYEVALEKQLERERQEAARREQATLDEIALKLHRRKAG